MSPKGVLCGFYAVWCDAGVVDWPVATVMSYDGVGNRGGVGNRLYDFQFFLEFARFFLLF